jgi:hypothetical protein
MLFRKYEHIKRNNVGETPNTHCGEDRSLIYLYCKALTERDLGISGRIILKGAQNKTHTAQFRSSISLKLYKYH